MIYIHKCLRCNHEWASKKEKPIRCAKCKTPYWDKERLIHDKR
jgi:DNA-directed RNA polymerase subunit RPC12/RpoP